MKLNLVLFFLLAILCNAQSSNRWQQGVHYDMNINMNEEDYKYEGKMTLLYENNSPEALSKVYFHLYYNAFQPGSAMDFRLQNILDPDYRMVFNAGTDENPKYISRISLLKENEIGYQKIKSLTQDGSPLHYKIMGTILEVTLAKPLPANGKTSFEMIWEAQIPLMIRRGGRGSEVEFSMTQWYPKMAFFDESGWHLDEYISREFAAPFADFDVKINMNEDYIIGASGKLQNANDVKGYSLNQEIKSKNKRVSWNFKAEKILDFAWVADKNFVVDTRKTTDNTEVYFVYKPEEETKKSWQDVQNHVMNFFEFMKENLGAYPWNTYTIAQGGDGGMEYGTISLISGGRDLESLAEIIFHELGHSWFQQAVATNETIDDWMDEGFASYMENLAMKTIFKKKIEPNPNPVIYEAYADLVKMGIEEPMSLLADYYNYNYSYTIESYYKGQIYLIQLGYIIGEENLKKSLKEYYNKWKFKHPDSDDFKRIAEEISGINLKWYNNLFINTTRFVDYGIKNVSANRIELENKSNFPMPIDLWVEYEDGSREIFYIPASEMRGEKQKENFEIYKNAKWTVLETWMWTNPNYTIETTKKPKQVIIDPSLRLADIDHSNNIYKK